MSSNPKIFLLGPTESGKTELTKFCYDNFKIEVLNEDSGQIYKGFNIGSAKPSAMDLKKYPHHLIDIVEPDTSYSVSHFRKDVESIYKNAEVMNRTPFLTGGTMMYFHSLEFPLDNIPPTTPKIRLKVEKEFLQLGLPSMYEKLV